MCVRAVRIQSYISYKCKFHFCFDPLTLPRSPPTSLVLGFRQSPRQRFEFSPPDLVQHHARARALTVITARCFNGVFGAGSCVFGCSEQLAVLPLAGDVHALGVVHRAVAVRHEVGIEIADVVAAFRSQQVGEASCTTFMRGAHTEKIRQRKIMMRLAVRHCATSSVHTHTFAWLTDLVR